MEIETQTKFNDWKQNKFYHKNIKCNNNQNKIFNSSENVYIFNFFIYYSFHKNKTSFPISCRFNILFNILYIYEYKFKWNAWNLSENSIYV